MESPQPRTEDRRLREELAAALGRGAAGLVNALDPDTVTLGGLAGPLRAAAPDAFHGAFEAGLMEMHRQATPDVATGGAGENAVLVGVGLSTFDRVLDAPQLARWASRAA
jgi:predicted NBD/HSP70 family sugar kinase